MPQTGRVQARVPDPRRTRWPVGSSDLRHACASQYDPPVVEPQTKTVELDADLVERAQREADKRGVTLKQLIDEALKRWLANNEPVVARDAA